MLNNIQVNVITFYKDNNIYIKHATTENSYK